MPSADDIANQRSLLATYRSTLAHYLSQQAIHGLAHVPPAVVHGIAEARAQIGQLKATLRGWGIEIEDLPGDEPTEPLAQVLEPRLDTFTALHQLRAVVSDFVGRKDEIARAVAALTQATARGAGAVCAIRGLGGSGKTELAYVIAQQLISLYPDAQIVIELRGTGRQSLSAHHALQSAIRAFEPHARLPDDLNHLQALYRSLLSGRRALVLADDAHSAAQLRPLLPPPGSGLLITSRQRFSLPGMAAIELEMLPQAAAEHMLLSICPRIGAEATQMARLCGALPLALRIGAGVLASDTTLPVDSHIQALSNERERLARLREPDDPAVGVEASLALSYDSLDLDAQSVLNQLSVFAAPFDLAAAEAVISISEEQSPPHPLRISSAYCTAVVCWSTIRAWSASRCMTWCGSLRPRDFPAQRPYICAMRVTISAWRATPTNSIYAETIRCLPVWRCSTASARTLTRPGRGPDNKSCHKSQMS